MSGIDGYLDDGALCHAGWTRALEDGDLLGQRCGACGATTATPKAACVRCGGRDLSVERLPTAGTVHSVTTIGVAPEGLDGGYDVAVVDLGPARILGRVDGTADIGDAVTLDGTVTADGGRAPRFVLD